MGLERSGQQVQVRGVGQRCFLYRWVVGECFSNPEPCVLNWGHYL